MALEDLTDLPDRINALPLDLQHTIRTGDQAQLWRIFLSADPYIQNLLESPEVYESLQMAGIGYGRNRVVSMESVTDSILSLTFNANLSLGQIKSAEQKWHEHLKQLQSKNKKSSDLHYWSAPRTWEVNNKAEHLAIMTSPFFLTEKRLEEFRQYEKSYGSNERAYDTVKSYKRSLRKNIPSPLGAARKFKDDSLRDEIDLFTDTQYWNLKNIHTNIRNMVKDPGNDVWFSIYRSPILENFGLLQVQLREKTSHSLSKHLAKEATEAILFDLLVEDLRGVSDVELDDLVEICRLEENGVLPRQFKSVLIKGHNEFLKSQKIEDGQTKRSMTLRDVQNYHLRSHKDWITHAEPKQDITGIQFITDEYFLPGEKLSRHKLVGRMMDVIFGNPDLIAARNKTMSKPSDAVFKVYCASARPATGQLPYIHFPHPEVMPTQQDLSRLSFDQQEVIYDRQLASSIHAKPSLADEFWYLHGVYGHKFYKIKSDPLQLPHIFDNKDIYNPIRSTYLQILSSNKYLKV